MEKKNYHQGHRERMRKRFLDTGSSSFQEHELLEILLFYSIPRTNTNETAHKLIDYFGNIECIFNANEEELTKIKGISEASSGLISFFSDLCRFYASETRKTSLVSEIEDVEKFVQEYFAESCSDSYLIMNMNSDLKLLNVSVIPENKTDLILSVRTIAEIALKGNMSKIIIGHNQFGKPPVPSSEEYSFICRAAETLSPLGIELYDYIICSLGKTFSARNHGAFSFAKGEK